MNTLRSALSYLPSICSVASLTLGTSKFFSAPLQRDSIDARLAFWTATGAPPPPPTAAEAEADQKKKKKIPLFDPHWHCWNISTDEAAPHDPSVLSDFLETFPQFFFADEEKYVADVAGDATDVPSSRRRRLAFVGGQHVEAIPKNFDGVREASWVRQQLEQHSGKKKNSSGDYFWAINGYVDLTSEEKVVRGALKNFVESKVHSVRQIVNFEPSWPHIKHDMLTDPNWKIGLLAEEEGIRAFELQCNPHQYAAAAAMAVKHAGKLNIVMNHLGCVTEKQFADPAGRDSYLRGLQQLASTTDPATSKRTVFMKLSVTMPYGERDNSHWTKSPLVRGIVSEVIRVFGPEHCMIASNFPVALFPLLPGDANGDEGYMRAARAWRSWVETLCAAVGDEAAEWIACKSACEAYAFKFNANSILQ